MTGASPARLRIDRLALPGPNRAYVRERGFEVVRTAARNFAPLGRKQWNGKLRLEDAAHALRLTFEDLGATFVKFGQLISSAPGIFGAATAAEFRSCLDASPAVPFAAVRTSIESNLGRRLEDVFADFDSKPLAAASIAVVHKARLHDGRDVAVKVLRPGIETRVAADLDLMEPLLGFLNDRVGLDSTDVVFDAVRGFREQLREELDLRNEVRTLEYTRATFEGMFDHLLVPEPYPEFSSRRVLTMSFLNGVPIDDLAKAGEFGVDTRVIVDELLRAWFLGAIRDGVFHGDVHAGNLLLLDDGRLGVVDWGIVGRMEGETNRFFRRLLQGALGDESAWVEVAGHIQREFSVTPGDLGLSDEDFVKLVRMQMEPILTQPFGEVSLAHLLNGTQQILDEFHGDVPQRRTVRQTLRRWKLNREMRAHIAANGAGGEFDRNSFLLGKQLVYFERYGKEFLTDTPLLGDRAFLEALLAE